MAHVERGIFGDPGPQDVSESGTSGLILSRQMSELQPFTPGGQPFTPGGNQGDLPTSQPSLPDAAPQPQSDEDGFCWSQATPTEEDPRSPARVLARRHSAASSAAGADTGPDVAAGRPGPGPAATHEHSPTIQKFQFFPGDVDYTTLKGRMAIQRSEGIVSDKPSSYELLVRMAETALLHMRDEGFHRLVAYVTDAGNKRLEFTPFAGSDSYMDAQRAVRDATLSLAGVPPSGPCLELRHIIAAENVVWKRAYLKKRAHGAQHLAADLLLF